MAKYRNIGSVLKSKDGNSTYIKISEDVTLKKGQILNLDNPRTKADELLAKGLISEEVATEMRAKGNATPAFVKFNITVKQA